MNKAQLHAAVAVGIHNLSRGCNSCAVERASCEDKVANGATGGETFTLPNPAPRRPDKHRIMREMAGFAANRFETNPDEYKDYVDLSIRHLRLAEYLRNANNN